MRTQNSPNSVDYTTFSQKFKQNLETLKDILGSETEINDLVHFLQGADGNIDIALNQILNSNERGKQPSKDIIKPSSPDKSPPDPLQAVLKQISEEVKCSYCLGYFREPVILGCLHSFCLDCVEEIVVKNSINCPLCRTVTRLNTGSVDELKRNHYLANIAEAIKSSKLTQMCSSCKSTMCTVYCNECKTVYCFSCNDNIHSSALLAGHKRIPFEECFSLARDKSISDWVIPFEVKKSLCSELFRRWVQQLWFAPADLISIAILENFETVYVPFWIFDVDVVINYMTTNIPTRWRYPIAPSDSITTSFPDILICGVESAESSFIDAIGPWSLDLMENSTFKHTEGVEVRSYSILETEAWERAKEKLEVLCKGICLQRIQKNAVIQPQQLGQVNIKNQFTNKKTRRLFLPVYRTSYTYKNRSYRLIINGSTGKVHGERPYSTNPLPLPNIVSGMNYLFSKLSKTSH